MKNLITFNCKILTSSKKYFEITFIHNDKINQSLLETLKKNNIPINYQCNSGYCGFCRIELISGKIKYYIDPLSCIKTDEILSCCCYPTEHIILKLN